MHRVPATGGTFKPAIASITEVFVAIEFSNVCFWLTKRFFSVLVDYCIHILTYKNATCCSLGCVSFFAECRNLLFNETQNFLITLRMKMIAVLIIPSNGQICQ